MEPKLIIDPLDVDAHLAAMGLDRHGLIMAVRYAEAERALCTDNDPIGFANLMAYARAARKLREYYPPRDQRWSSDNSFNQAAIRNAHTRVRIVPCNFDEAAGDRRATPTNRSPKGEVSRHKSACNRTAWIPGLVEPGAPVDVDGIRTWVLGMHFEETRSVRAELSMPIEFDGQFFTDFGRRIFFLDEDDGSEIIKSKDDDDGFGIVNIEINRK